MKVSIGKYRSHTSFPRFYDQWLMLRYKKSSRFDAFMLDDEGKTDKYDAMVQKLEDRLEYLYEITINRVIKKIISDERKVKVRIDDYDTWNGDTTLALIIHPLLVKFSEDVQGHPMVDNEDVPEELRSPCTKKDDYKCWENDPNGMARWEWVLNEMKWTFEQFTKDGSFESDFYHGEPDFYFEKDEENPHLSTMKEGDNNTFWVDREGLKECEARIDNGLRLFGKYFRNLWN